MTSFITTLLARLVSFIQSINVPNELEVDARVEEFAAKLQREADAEKVKAEALRDVAIAASLQAVDADRAADYRRDLAEHIRRGV